MSISDLAAAARAAGRDVPLVIEELFLGLEKQILDLEKKLLPPAPVGQVAPAEAPAPVAPTAP